MGKAARRKKGRREDYGGGGGARGIPVIQHNWKRKNPSKGDKRRPLLLSERSFETQQEDHCETPLQAFKDLELLLCSVAKKLNKKKAELSIYDPFYCEGTMKSHLRSLGFGRVYNEKEDFYEMQRKGKVPEHDVLVTNPPFSGDHIERLFHFCLQSNHKRPFFLLLPQFVATKQYFSSMFPEQASVFYLLPKGKGYQFWAPGREREGIRGRFVLPKAHGKEFQCFWYVCLHCSREQSERAVNVLKSKSKQQQHEWTIARDLDDLPKTFKTKKRLNPRQRAKLKLQRAKQMGK